MFVYIIYFLVLLCLFNLSILTGSYSENFLSDSSYAEHIANEIRDQLGDNNIVSPSSETVCISN